MEDSVEAVRWKVEAPATLGVGIEQFQKVTGEVPSFYGFKNDDALYTPEGKRVRSDVDMLGLITKDDPPVYVSSSLADTPPKDCAAVASRRCNLLARARMVLPLDRSGRRSCAGGGLGAGDAGAICSGNSLLNGSLLRQTGGDGVRVITGSIEQDSVQSHRCVVPQVSLRRGGRLPMRPSQFPN